jgi:hypothetical protein
MTASFQRIGTSGYEWLLYSRFGALAGSGGSSSAEPPVRCDEVEHLRIEPVGRPLDQLVVLGIPSVGERSEEALVAWDAAAVLRWTCPAAVETHRVALALDR